MLPILSTHYVPLHPRYLVSSRLMPQTVDYGPIVQKSKPRLGEASKFVQHPAANNWLNRTLNSGLSTLKPGALLIKTENSHKGEADLMPLLRTTPHFLPSDRRPRAAGLPPCLLWGPESSWEDTAPSSRPGCVPLAGTEGHILLLLWGQQETRSLPRMI